MYTRDKDIQVIYITVGVGERIHKRDTFGERWVARET